MIKFLQYCKGKKAPKFCAENFRRKYLKNHRPLVTLVGESSHFFKKKIVERCVWHARFQVLAASEISFFALFCCR
jgi:hypothetical protein